LRRRKGKNVNRRKFLQTMGAAGGTSLVAGAARARDVVMPSSKRVKEPEPAADDAYAVLVDLTACVGCRTCEEACAAANGLPDPDWSDDFSYESERSTSPQQWVAVNRRETTRGEVFLRGQCMHCVEPACAAACLTKAMYKTPEGPVIWREDKCMGCRFCMLSCPFGVPKFEYDSPNPRIQKCQLCWERVKEGQVPACVENCPAEALTFGKRKDLLEIARQRIYQNPDQYHPHIYGEHEAGGTSWLYISPVPFEELGVPTDLGDSSYPELTRDFLTAVPVVLLLWPAFLLGLYQSTRREEVRAHEASERESEEARDA
jgi:formate dehydrogenase iron-sulfur subunit